MYIVANKLIVPKKKLLQNILFIIVLEPLHHNEFLTRNMSIEFQDYPLGSY